MGYGQLDISKNSPTPQLDKFQNITQILFSKYDDI